MKTLYLTLKKKPFEVMKIGEKKSEYRENSKWMRSRLFNKDGTKKSMIMLSLQMDMVKHDHILLLNLLTLKKYMN